MVQTMHQLIMGVTRCHLVVLLKRWICLRTSVNLQIQTTRTFWHLSPHSGWSLLPAIQRILESWPTLKSYLVSVENEDCPSIIRAFVCGATDAENVHGTVAECVLAFMHNLMQEFDSSIRNLESDCATVIEVHSVMNHLQGQLISRRKDQFYGNKAKQTPWKLLPLQQERSSKAW